MIWGMGLPRHGGQTLKHALHVMFGSEYKYYHSVDFMSWHVASQPSTLACLEVFAPVMWCNMHFGHRPHYYIVNRRQDHEAWMTSMHKVHRRAHEENWNHPIWRYHPSMWSRYAFEYYNNVINDLVDMECKWVEIDPTACGHGGFNVLADLFGVAVDPSWVWPNVDQFGRKSNESTRVLHAGPG